MRLGVGGWAAALALAAFLGATAAEGRETKEVKGKVVAACPEGLVLKVKTCCDKEVTFNVCEKAREQVRGLKAGDGIQVSFDECPRTKKFVVIALKKL